MRTFFGNASSIIIGLCIGLITPAALLYGLLKLLAHFGLVQSDSILELIVVSGRPEFFAVRFALILCSIFAAVYMVANLAVSRKLQVALWAGVPLIFLGFLCFFGIRTETDRWIDSFLFHLWTQPLEMKVLFVMAALLVLAVFGVAAWYGAKTGSQSTNLFTKQPRQKSIPLKPPTLYVGSVRVGHSVYGSAVSNQARTIEG